MDNIGDFLRRGIAQNSDTAFRVTARGIVVVASACAIFLASVVTYVTFVRVYMPEISHTVNLNFIFATECGRNPLRDEGLCSFPYANVSFPSSSSVFSRGQAYEVALRIHLPESERNLHVGMFLVRLSFYDQSGRTLFSAQKSAMLRYRSDLLRYFDRVAFYLLYVLGIFDESQTVQLSLVQSYVDNGYFPSRGLLVQLESPFIEVYSGELTATAQLSGIRYLLYNYPIISAFFGVAYCATVYIFIVLVSGYAIYRKLHKANDSDSNPTPTQTSAPDDSVQQIADTSLSADVQSGDVSSSWSPSPTRSASKKKD